MSILNTIVGCACGAIFLSDLIVANFPTPRALASAKQRAQPQDSSDVGYQSNIGDVPTPIEMTVQGMDKAAFARLQFVLLCSLPAGAFIGYMGTKYAESVLADLNGMWSCVILTGALVGIGFPALLQFWALSMDLLCFIRTGKGPMHLPLNVAFIETLDIAIHDHQLFNRAIYIIFLLSGIGVGCLVASFRFLYLTLP